MSIAWLCVDNELRWVTSTIINPLNDSIVMVNLQGYVLIPEIIRHHVHIEELPWTTGHDLRAYERIS